jgi:hypothetical protein
MPNANQIDHSAFLSAARNIRIAARIIATKMKV